MTYTDSSIPSPQASGDQTGDTLVSKATITDEQVRAIADQVYAMLLRDLKQEQERDRAFLATRNVIRGVR